jgi:mono/diheme cytochrome c family protein
MNAAIKLALILVIVLSLSFLYAAPADKAKGKELYVKNCVSCHSETGVAKPAIEKMFTTMKPLGSKEVQSKTDADLVKNILQPTGKMKAVKLSEAEAADIVAYLRTLTPPKK